MTSSTHSRAKTLLSNCSSYFSHMFDASMKVNELGRITDLIYTTEDSDSPWFKLSLAADKNVILEAREIRDIWANFFVDSPYFIAVSDGFVWHVGTVDACREIASLQVKIREPIYIIKL